MAYIRLTIFCLGVAAFFIFKSFFVSEKEEVKEDFLTEFSQSNFWEIKTAGLASETPKWIFETRFNNYKENLQSLKGATSNILVILALGILLIFYRPDGIQISFLSVKIPEGLLYLIIVFGSFYTWSNFGLELNSAIRSRLALHDNLETLINNPIHNIVNSDKDSISAGQKPSEALFDHGVVDNWVVHFFPNHFNVSGDEKIMKVWSSIGLYGLYGLMAGSLFALSFITSIELGDRKKRSKFYSNVLLVISIGVVLTPCYFWATSLHTYSAGYIGYMWVIAAIWVYFWNKSGKHISEKLREILQTD